MKRWGRALQPHPTPLATGDGRTLVTRQAVAELLQLNVAMVRRTVEPVACHVATRAWLVDIDEAERALAGKSRRVAVDSDAQ